MKTALCTLDNHGGCSGRVFDGEREHECLCVCHLPPMTVTLAPPRCQRCHGTILNGEDGRWCFNCGWRDLPKGGVLPLVADHMQVAGVRL